MATRKVLSVNNDAELLSYIINVTPELREEIDLPKQGEDILPIGKIIVNNQRYRNAFINTVNMIGLTIIKRNRWENPWDFTVRGNLRMGQQIREMILDLVDAKDYNAKFEDTTAFLENVVPNVYQYIHEINFQKYYETTTSDEQLAMAFTEEGNLMNFIEEAISMLYESFEYDKYIIDKYQLCRRILDGTMTSVEIADFESKTAREKVSAIKGVSNKMTFRSPNYNPAGIRKATSFDDQILIVSTEFEAEFSTEVLATSFFRDEADMKARLVLIDSFSEHDTERLTSTLGDAYVAFTEDELAQLGNIPAVLVSREFFMDYYYAMDNDSQTKTTEFFNPANLTNNHFLHTWLCFSTSPFENACVMSTVEPEVSSVTITPSTATLSAGLSTKLVATVATEGFANKGVVWSVSGDATIKQDGTITINSDAVSESTITVTATSVYDSTVSGTATITVA